MIVGTRPLAGWVIVLDGARNFLGLPGVERKSLSPVYEFRTMVTPQTGIARQVVPVLFYPVSRLEIDISSHPVIKLNDLPVAEVEILQKAVSSCEEAMIELRAHQTGLVTAAAMPKAKLQASLISP